MEEKSIDVELEALFANNSEETEPSVASDEKSETNDTQVVVDEPKAEVITPRAEERIRNLVKETKFNKVDEFINAIEDEPSRNLLKQFAGVLQEEYSATIDKRFNPIVSDYNSTKFDKEFEQYIGKAPSLASHKADLKQSFLRDPNQSIKALVGEVIADTILNKIRPIEGTASIAQRGTPDISNASKDDLYSMLEAMRPN